MFNEGPSIKHITFNIRKYATREYTQLQYPQRHAILMQMTLSQENNERYSLEMAAEDHIMAVNRNSSRRSFHGTVTEIAAKDHMMAKLQR